MKPHAHEWGPQFSKNGLASRRCHLCNKWAELALVSPPFEPLDDLTTVNGYGGISDYEPGTKLVTTGEGSVFSLGALLEVNPNIPAGEIIRDLEDLAFATTPSTLSSGAERQIPDMAEPPIPETTKWMVSETEWTSDDAIALIFEEIKHGPDPLNAAGEWLTKFTNGIAAIVREMEEE